MKSDCCKCSQDTLREQIYTIVIIKWKIYVAETAGPNSNVILFDFVNIVHKLYIFTGVEHFILLTCCQFLTTAHSVGDDVPLWF